MMEPPRILCVGAHHKTGTTWMKGVFFSLAKRLDIPVMRVPNPRVKPDIPDEGRVLLTNWRSRFNHTVLAHPEARFFHIIRDPRDVLISGAHYHETTDGIHEKFLYHPRKELDGKSYQEHLRALPSYEEKLAFEMGGKHLDTIIQYREWDFDNPRSFEVKYEDLIEDTDCSLFRKAMDFFGLTDEETEIAARVFHDNSLFGRKGETLRASEHVRSGQAAQWERKMPLPVAELYAERYGDDLIRLGYETDDRWVDRIAAREAGGERAKVS